MRCNQDEEHRILSTVVSKFKIKYGIADITPPPSPEKKGLQKIASENKSDRVVSSPQDDEIVFVPRLHRLKKENNYLLNCILKPFVSNNLNNLIVTVDSKNKTNNNPFRKNKITVNNKSVHYNDNNPFAILIQAAKEKNIESNISQICCSSLCKAENSLVTENFYKTEGIDSETNVQSFEDNSCEEIENNLIPSCLLTNNSDNDNSNVVYDVYSVRTNNYDIYEDEFLPVSDHLPTTVVSIFEPPKDNLTLESNDDWYISPDDEYIKEVNHVSNSKAENLNTRMTKKQYPKLSTNSKYYCTDIQEENQSSRTPTPKTTEYSESCSKNNNKITTPVSITNANNNTITIGDVLNLWNTSITNTNLTNTFEIRNNYPQYNNNNQYNSGNYLINSLRSQINQVLAYNTNSTLNSNTNMQNQIRNNSTILKQEFYNNYRVSKIFSTIRCSKSNSMNKSHITINDLVNRANSTLSSL